MTILAIVLLILLGLFLLILEFAVIPGVTIAGIGGAAMLIASIYLAFSRFGTLAGLLTLLFLLVSAPLLFYYLFKTRAGRKMILNTKIDGKVETFEPDKIKPGDSGMTIGRLAPMGKVRINGETVEAQSAGGYIEQNRPVRVLKVSFNKIIVELIKTE